MTLGGYDKWVQNSEEIDELRQAGLTEEEIDFRLNSQNNCPVQVDEGFSHLEEIREVSVSNLLLLFL